MRLKGSTVLLVMVYLTNGLAESGENLEKMWELANLIRDRELPFICMGDLNMTPEEMQKTELVSSTGAVIKTLVRVEYTCTSGHRLLDYRRLASVVQVEPYWAVLWKSHVALEVTVCRAPRTHTMRIACIPKKIPQGKSVGKDNWDKNWATRQGPLFETGGKRALYHRWLAAAEECILQSCEPRSVPRTGHGVENKNSAQHSPA